MLKDLFYEIYMMPSAVLICFVCLTMAGGTALHLLTSSRAKHIVGTVGSALFLWFIIYSTLLSRSEVAGDVVLEPGYSLRLAAVNDVYLRMVLMNIFLFVPFAVFLSLAFSGHSFKKTLLTTLLSGLTVTLLVEILQYIFKLGCAETDDVICNFLGTAIGVLPFVVARLFKKARLHSSES